MAWEGRDVRVTLRSSGVDGRVRAPPSKSMTHRALLLGALARGRTTIENPLSSEDTEATSRVLAGLGVSIESGKSWVIEGGELGAPLGDLDCGESGTTLRFIVSACGLARGTCRLTGGSSLLSRPVGPLVDALRDIGVQATSDSGHPPVEVEGEGTIPGGRARVPGHISSQFVSALLLVAPLAESSLDIEVTTPLESKPYVSMTMDAMRDFDADVVASPRMDHFYTSLHPYRAARVEVEGDWSSAAFTIAAGTLGGESVTSGLSPASSQADRAVVDILGEMGAILKVESGGVRSSWSKLSGIDYDLSDCPDLFPIASALCAASGEESKLHGLTRLRLKESDRLEAMAEGLRRMGAEVEVSGGEARIRGGHLSGAEVYPRRDHRIAMALAVASLAAEGETTIADAECVSKSYPGFWADMEELGVRVMRK